MPSLAAKSENKISSNDAADPVKQVQLLMERRIRNLEKRKGKLDNYRLDVKNGKELNEDQKIAVSKYEEVDSQLNLMRDLYKSSQTVIQESTRQQKKLAKREHLERQQHEIQRLQEAFIFRHILSFFENEDVRNDFLNGANGAVQLTSEQLSQLDQFYKLISPGLPTEQADVTNYFHALAENFIFLVEGKNKEIVGTTYKVLQDLLLSIKECEYFSRPSVPVEEDSTSSEDIPEDEIAVNENEENQEEIENVDIVEESQPDEEANIEESMGAVSLTPEPVPCNEVSQYQNGPLQDVLSSQSAFNFLQESQIDLDAPHMDPAVVAVHQMAPPPPASVNFGGNVFANPAPIEEKPLVASENCDLSNHAQVNQVPILPAAIPRTVAPVLSSVQLNSQQEFDPSHPIPTQTFTNQSFAVMQNMILPQAYVPVTMHHGPMPHIAPVAVVPGLSSTVNSGTASVPMPVSASSSVAPIADDEDSVEQKTEPEEILKPSEDTPVNEMDSNSVNNNERNGENNYNSYRGNGFRRGRGRGNNGYFRGRSNYNGRGGYQNHYYDRNGYNGNFRRGNNRGPRGNGNNRGRGNYRAQTSQTSHQQQTQQ